MELPPFTKGAAPYIFVNVWPLVCQRFLDFCLRSACFFERNSTVIRISISMLFSSGGGRLRHSAMQAKTFESSNQLLQVAPASDGNFPAFCSAKVSVRPRPVSAISSPREITKFIRTSIFLTPFELCCALAH